MAQLFSQMWSFLVIIATIGGLLGLGIALFQLWVMLRHDSNAQQEARALARFTRSSGSAALGAVWLIGAYLFAAAAYGLLAWFALEVAWIILSTIYNAFVPTYPNCFPTLTDLTACSPSATIQATADQVTQWGAVIYGLYKGFDALSERPRTAGRPPAAPTPLAPPPAKGGPSA